MNMVSNTIVLNVDHTILGTTNWKRAMCLVVSGKAESVKDSDWWVHPAIPVPLVIRLVKAIRNLWRKEVPWSKNAVHVRDNYVCQYCGTKVTQRQATIDHVIPRAQGGKNKWENTVCSCYDCNNSKQDRTPSQAEMSLRRKPSRPTIMEFILMKIHQDGLEQLLKDLKVF